MRSYHTSVFISIFLAAVLGLGLIVMPVSAQFSEVSGAYVNTEAGVEIEFPAGWEGTEISTQGSTIVSVFPGGLEAAGSGTAMSLIVSDKTDAPEPDPSGPPNVPEDSTVECGTASVSNVNLAGVTAIQSTVECTIDGTATKTKSVIVDTQTKWVLASFTGPSAEFDQNVAAFDSSLATLEVDGAVSAGGIPGVIIDLHLSATIQTVVIAGENVNLDVRSNSTLSAFELNEETKTLSFTVDGETGTQGRTEITIGRALEGPYTVTIDGQTTTDFEETVSASGEAMLAISYTHSEHDVDVTGTSVVPEFPVALLGVIAAIVGVVAILGRTRFVTGYRQT